VVPAAHYVCGGVLTDLHGRTSLGGLFAAGETACTGVHGANRLASNSLLEALVFAHRAADRISGDLGSAAPVEVPTLLPEPGEATLEERILLVHDREELRSLMWDLVGIVRSDERLAIAAARIEQIASQNRVRWERTVPDLEMIELRNLLQTAGLIIRSARRRRESRGLHYNVDVPYLDNERFLAPTVLRREQREQDVA
jgi:L-aspartate oxidase